jgi:hypothetical protein
MFEWVRLLFRRLRGLPHNRNRYRPEKRYMRGGSR